MNKINIIARKELASFFDSLIAYILLVVFLGVSGIFTWLLGGGDVFFRGQADLQVFFSWAYWILFVFIAALTMKMFAEENRSGTIDLLLTRDITDWQVVLGKFFACLELIIIALLCTIPYYITVATLGDIDHGATIAGYIGLIFMSSVYISIGLLASALSKNQFVAFLMTLFVGIFFHFVFGMIASNLAGALGAIVSYLSLQEHVASITRGVVDSRDLVYFVTLTLLALVLTEVTLGKRNIASN